MPAKDGIVRLEPLLQIWCTRGGQHSAMVFPVTLDCNRFRVS